jgi:hypothetical protein
MDRPPPPEAEVSLFSLRTVVRHHSTSSTASSCFGDYSGQVNWPQSNAELTALRNSVRKGTPYGSGRFVTQSAARLQLDYEEDPEKK